MADVTEITGFIISVDARIEISDYQATNNVTIYCLIYVTKKASVAVRLRLGYQVKHPYIR